MTTLPDIPIEVDGSHGEGGGQILRSSLALSMLTGRPFAIRNIRAGRQKPGLLRQHLAAVKAAGEISHAGLSGAELCSAELGFQPGPVDGGSYHFAVGTAGSTMLILQTILLPLCLAREPSEVVLEGGTHNPFAPPFDFLHRAFLPVIARMGAKVRMKLEKPGFYPAGGGRVVVHVEPCPALRPIDLLERGELKSRAAVAMVSNIPLQVAERELKLGRRRLDLGEQELQAINATEADGPGNVFMVVLEFSNLTELFTGFGELGTKAERLARKTCDQAERYLKSDAPVGDYLADQLLLPMAVAGGGSFRCTALSSHFQTNVGVIEQFLPIKITTGREDRLAWLVTINAGA